MTGRVCIVTGSNTGIGFATARGLSALGATVVLACRDPEKARSAAQEIRARVPAADPHVEALDLLSQESVRSFAIRVQARFPRLHVLVNNAGVLMSRRVLSADGHEATLATNHLSPFLLTQLLLPRLKASAPSRVVFVTSEAQRQARIRFEDLQGNGSWSGFRAYSQSKLANVAIAIELAQRLQGTGVTSNCVHPGVVRTRWARNGGPVFRGVVKLLGPLMASPARGADTVVWAASAPELDKVSGKYFAKRREKAPNPAALDSEVRRRLWDASEALVGLRRDAPLVS